MAKYTIISLISTDFVPIFFIINLFGGHSVSKKSLIDLRGGVNPFQKSTNPAKARGGSSPL